jgi:hypothetical protein
MEACRCRPERAGILSIEHKQRVTGVPYASPRRLRPIWAGDAQLGSNPVSAESKTLSGFATEGLSAMYWNIATRIDRLIARGV